MKGVFYPLLKFIFSDYLLRTFQPFFVSIVIQSLNLCIRRLSYGCIVDTVVVIFVTQLTIIFVINFSSLSGLWELDQFLMDRRNMGVINHALSFLVLLLCVSFFVYKRDCPLWNWIVKTS